MEDKFRYKTYGRIFVRPEDAHRIGEVYEIMKEVDEFEYNYVPDDFVTAYDPDKKINKLVYLHKFEMDKIALQKACLAKGIMIWCVDGGRIDYEYI